MMTKTLALTLALAAPLAFGQTAPELISAEAPAAAPSGGSPSLTDLLSDPKYAPFIQIGTYRARTRFLSFFA